MTYDAWKTREPEPDDDDSRPVDYDLGYSDGWRHGYESALHDAEQVLLTKQRTIQAYGMDCEVIQIDEALDAIAELRKAKP